MGWAYMLLFACLTDFLLGDPPSWPHPVRWMGRIIACWESVLYKEKATAGFFFWLASVGSIMALFALLAKALSLIPSLLEAAAFVYLAYTCLAARSLHLESRKVESALACGRLDQARRDLSLIVSRQTAHLGPSDVRRAVLETVAENLSDGVIAPLFYGLTLGLPGMIFYKAVNTMDSMVGYKNEKYVAFGRAAARADDVLNYLPARLTGLLMVATAALLRMDAAGAWRTMRRDAKKAVSPNAGWPEAALAGGLGLRLGGPDVYFGLTVEKPYIGDNSRALCAGDYRAAVRLLYGASCLMTAAVCSTLLCSRAGLFGLAGLLA